MVKICKLINETYKAYSELDPQKKDATWANNSIAQYRMFWRPMIDLARSQLNKEYLFGLQSMEKIKRSFKDKKFLKETDFEPIDVMFNIRNSLTEEIVKAPPKAEVRATDPLAMSDREKDIQMLKSRKILESDISKYNAQIGLPAYKMPYDNFKGNIKDFDKMGLNENESEDINFYQNNFQRLDYEISGQQVVNNIMKANRFDEDKIPKYMIDILANNIDCSQVYVDKLTGEIKTMYIYPETAYAIANDSNDGYNDIAKGWQDTKTVQEFLQMAGNEFDWNKDWPKLLWAINYRNNAKYTGFIRNGVSYNALGGEYVRSQAGLDGTEQLVLLDWSLAYTYKVYCGFIEWNTCEATGTYVFNKKKSTDVQQVPYDYDLKTRKNVDEYQKESYYQQQWYSSFFICTSSISQWIFNFGKVYYQELKGSNDEYSSGTLKYYMREGKSAIEIARPYIDFVNFAFYRLKWLIWHAKPEEDVVVIEELIQISKGLSRMYPQTAGTPAAPIESMLKQIITFQRENFVRVRSFPQIDGKTIGQLPQLEGKRNGIDNLAAQMLQIEQWAESQIAIKIGINAMRLGANPQSRESFQSEQSTVQASVNTTGYLYRMIQNLKERIATTSIIYAQDILNYKDSIPYNWLKKLLGNVMFASLNVLDNVVGHRFGIFIRDYNSDIDRNDLKQAASMALNQKMINLDGWAIVTQTEDPKLGFKMLSYMQLKATKKLRQQQLQDKQIEDQMAQAQFQRESQLIKMKLDADIKRAQLAKDAATESATINTDGRVKVKEITIGAEGPKMAAKTESGKELAFAKEDAQRQATLPAAAGG